LSEEIAEIEERVKQLTDPNYDPTAILKEAAAGAEVSNRDGDDAQSSEPTSDSPNPVAAADARCDEQGEGSSDGGGGDDNVDPCVSGQDDELSAGGSEARGDQSDGEHDDEEEEAVVATATSSAVDDVGEQGGDEIDDDESDAVDDVMTMDQQLVTSVLLALKGTLNTKTDLPILVAVFYAKHVLPASRRVCPGARQLSVYASRSV
jgi:hypothetical protein